MSTNYSLVLRTSRIERNEVQSEFVVVAAVAVAAVFHGVLFSVDDVLADQFRRLIHCRSDENWKRSTDCSHPDGTI